MGSDVEASTAASPFFSGPTNAAPAPQAALAANVAKSTSLKARVAALGGLTHGELTVASKADLHATLERLLAALKNVPQGDLQLGERHQDGSLQISSHLAVWLIGKVADGYGGKLVRLSKVSDRETLRSLDGLTRLLHGSIATKGQRKQ